jgi:hypothetical protein
MIATHKVCLLFTGIVRSTFPINCELTVRLLRHNGIADTNADLSSRDRGGNVALAHI